MTIEKAYRCGDIHDRQPDDGGGQCDSEWPRVTLSMSRYYDDDSAEQHRDQRRQRYQC